MKKIKALVQKQYLQNVYFSSKMPQIIYANSSVQRSDENYCFNKFKKIFRQNNFDINTYDIDDNPDIEFAFQFNYKKLNKKKTLRYCI